MEDALLNARIDPLIKRAYEIKMVTENLTRKDFVGDALAAKIEPHYMETARQAIEKENETNGN